MDKPEKIKVVLISTRRDPLEENTKKQVLWDFCDDVEDSENMDAFLAFPAKQKGDNSLAKTIWGNLKPNLHDKKISEYKNIISGREINSSEIISRIASATEFWEVMRICNQETPDAISNKFTGKLRRYKQSNVFLYHHWLDKQLFHSAAKVVIDYFTNILRDMLKLLDNKNEYAEYEWHVFLHKGDFVLKKDENKDKKPINVHLRTDDFDNIELKEPCLMATIGENLFLYSFSHRANHILWDYVLNNKSFLDEINSIKPMQIANYLLDRVVPDKVIKRFEKFLKNESE